MKPRLTAFITYVVISILGVGGALAEVESRDGKSRLLPLSHLIDSVQDLRSKRIPQAYFLLESPNTSARYLFFPDTKGGAYILLWSDKKIPDKEASWKNLTKILKPWKVSAEEVQHLADSNAFWKVRKGDLVVKIPVENTKIFYDALMKAWKTNEKDFKCFAGWN